MKEYSEKELEDEYRNCKLQDIPDLWDGIEANLAPKKRKRGRQISFRPAATMAAAVLVLLVAAPVAANALKFSKVGNDSAAQMSGSGMDNNAASADGEKAADTVPREQLDWEGQEESLDSDSPSAVESASMVPKEQGIVEVQVLEAWQEAGAIRVRASLLEETERGGMPTDSQAGDIVTFIYEGEDYETSDFSGVLTLSYVKEENKFKILEILP